MDERLNYLILAVFLLGFVSCQELVISPKQDTLVKKVDEGLSLKCTVEGLTEAETPSIQWFSATGEQITSKVGRMRVMSFSSNELTLLIRKLVDGDEGQYTCKATISGNPIEKNIEIQLYRGITIKGSPHLQRPNINTDAFIECDADANPVPTVHWTFANEDPIPSGSRYVQQKEGLIIKNISEEDNGIYYCLINVGEMGDFRQYNITVQVTIPPKFDRPATSTDAIVGKRFEMSCYASGNPPPLFTFFKDDNPNPLDMPKFKVDKTNGKLEAEVMEEMDSGKYKCVASNEAEGVRGTTTGGQKEQTLDIVVKIPSKITEVRDASGLMDTQAELTCIAEGNPAPDVTWKKFSTDSTFAADSTLTQNAASEFTVEELPSGNKRVTSKYVFTSLKPSDTGAYTCTAINTAGTAVKNATLTVEFKPNFDNTPYTKTYGWASHETNITCLANGEPQAYIEWSRNDEVIANNNETYKISSKLGKGYVASYLMVSVKVENEEWIYGDFLCTAKNGRGASTQVISLAKAETPGAVILSTDKTTPTSIEVLITPPGNEGGQPVIDYKIEYNLQGSTDIKTSYAQRPGQDAQDQRTKARLTDLMADSVYMLTVRARNAVGYGQPQTMTEQTPKVRKPDPVTFNSKGFGNNADSYTVSWEKPLTGGRPLTGYKIVYRKVEVKGEDESNWEVVRMYEDENRNAPRDVTSYKITGLVPDTFYQVEVTAINQLGASESRGKIFKTSKGGEPLIEEVPAPPKPDTKPAEVSGAGMATGAIIGTIIAILIILFIIIDVSFYFNKQCGVLWTLQQKLAGKPPGESDGARDMEEGDKENKQPLLTEAKAEEVNEEEVPEKKNEALEGVMEEMSPDEKEAKQIAEMADTSPIKPDSPIVPQSEATIIVNPATPEAESHDDKPVA
ncbi:hypothetical protein SNE40_017187 [Patella caerulea]|uniref:Uncharacterized protein n=1 Tax=Patella caerulea TaxID=87958 RepID=A0AAN8PF93_PATCE